ncbi:hypothetical protein [Rugamonas sp. DEMB1]|uniref:hypothetical protein n=1 Tax=Rugamonas sp. DEMB1 TaxID=3039386 RepID=UPI0024481A3C|nr:hypothetical protein [Rugamonas sp. DEMB1]WGG50481.1 hypothetical protein QC826_29445 [Rugamonas sp. DEMB1]
MTVFDANPAAESYPDMLRAVRNELFLSQSAFAVAAGYSAVMQGRYETARNKPNSAIPSDKTAKAIKMMVEAERAKQQAASQAPSAAEVQPLKSISPHQLEQLFGKLLSQHTGAPCVVSVDNAEFSNGGLRMTVSLAVEQALPAA